MKRVIISGILLLALFCPSFGQNEVIQTIKSRCNTAQLYCLFLESKLPEINYRLNTALQENECSEDSIENIIVKLNEAIANAKNAATAISEKIENSNDIDKVCISSVNKIDCTLNALSPVFGQLRTPTAVMVDSIEKSSQYAKEAYDDSQVGETYNTEIDSENCDVEDNTIEPDNKEIKSVILFVLVGILFVFCVVLTCLVMKLFEKNKNRKRQIEKLESLVDVLKDNPNKNIKTNVTNNTTNEINSLKLSINSIKSEILDIQKKLSNNTVTSSQTPSISKAAIESLISDQTKLNIQNTRSVNTPKDNHSKRNEQKSTPKPQKTYYKLYGKADARGEKKLYKVTENVEPTDLFVVLLDTPDSTTGIFTLREDCSIDLQRSAIANRGKTIDPVCDVFEAEANARYINVEDKGEGKVHKENGEWIVDEKMFVTLKA